MKYEEALAKLEAIVEKMERGDMNIDTLASELKKAQGLIKVTRNGITEKLKQQIKAIDNY